MGHFVLPKSRFRSPAREEKYTYTLWWANVPWIRFFTGGRK